MPEDRARRHVCPKCKTIAYRNPKILVTTIVACGESVLLCLRANSPARNRWTAPTGFVECGETLEEAAVREIREETHITIEPIKLDLYAVSTLQDICEVYVAFRVEVQNSDALPGHECKDVRYFSEKDLPWEKLAYPEMVGFFRLFFREKRNNVFAVHLTDLTLTRIVRRSYRISMVKRSVEVERPRRRRPG